MTSDENEEFPREVLDEWTVPEMPSDMKERVMAQMHEQWNMGVPTHAYGAPPKKNGLAVALFASGVALAAAGVAAVFVMGKPDVEPMRPVPREPIAATPAVVAAPAVARGHLTIAVTPADAKVELDGVALAGPSPFVATDLAVGAHELRVTRDGHAEWKRVIQVPDSQLHLPIVLAPAAPALDEEVPLEPSDGLAEKVPAELLEKHAPVVRQALAVVKGTMDKDIIRRIVRAHIGEVRSCYNEGLAKDPTLTGRVVIQFTIDASGKVPKAVVEETTLPDDAVGECIVDAAKRWTFPKPEGGGNVVVSYPFVLEPG